MTTDLLSDTTPLWLSIEEQIEKMDSGDFDAGKKDETVQRIARALDSEGANVSRHGGNLLMLRKAVDARIEVGSPMLADFNSAVQALSLDDVVDPFKATVKLVGGLGETWPAMQDLDRRADVLAIVERTKLDLLVDNAKGMDGNKGVRYLIEHEVAEASIVERLEISDDKLAEVKKVIAAEDAEKERINGLLEAVESESDEEKAKHLISHDVSEENILNVAGIDQPAIDAAKELMAAELAEKKRLEEEAAAAKKAAAEGPALDAIPADEMLDFIEQLREILEFSDVEDEIRQMAEQSSIPKSLVDVAVSDADKLDELEAQAEG